MVATVSAIAGGFIGTAFLTLSMMVKHKISMMPPDWDIMKDGVGTKMKELMGLPESMVFVQIVNFMIGSLLIPLGFVWIWLDFLEIDIVNIYITCFVFVLIFGTTMISMLGFLGAPPDWRMTIAIGIIIRHLIYGSILAFFVDQSWFD